MYIKMLHSFLCAVPDAAGNIAFVLELNGSIEKQFASK